MKKAVYKFSLRLSGGRVTSVTIKCRLLALYALVFNTNKRVSHIEFLYKTIDKIGREKELDGTQGLSTAISNELWEQLVGEDDVFEFNELVNKLEHGGR